MHHRARSWRAGAFILFQLQMQRMITTNFEGFAACRMVLGISVTAHGQSFPAKPVRLIVPFSPGGGTDIATRIIAPKLSERFGQQAIVDNRPGAAGGIGTEATVKSAPDGYVLLIGSTSEIAISPSLYAKLPYDVLCDLLAAAPFASTSMVLVVMPALPVNSAAELATLARTPR